jgi:hypothetical protein
MFRHILTCFHNTFQISSSNSSFVLFSTPKIKQRFHTAAICSFTLRRADKNCLFPEYATVRHFWTPHNFMLRPCCYYTEFRENRLTTAQMFKGRYHGPIFSLRKVRYKKVSSFRLINTSFASQMSCFNPLPVDLKMNIKAVKKKEITAYHWRWYSLRHGRENTFQFQRILQPFLLDSDNLHFCMPTCTCTYSIFFNFICFISN